MGLPPFSCRLPNSPLLPVIPENVFLRVLPPLPPKDDPSLLPDKRLKLLGDVEIEDGTLLPLSVLLRLKGQKVAIKQYKLD